MHDGERTVNPVCIATVVPRPIMVARGETFSELSCICSELRFAQNRYPSCSNNVPIAILVSSFAVQRW